MPVVAANTKRPTFSPCGCSHVGFVGASVKANTRIPLYLGAANDCGPRPVITNYGRGADRDTESYRQDLADYNACIRAAKSAPAPIVVAAPAAPAAAPAPPAPPAPAAANPNSDDAIATSALSWTSSIGMHPEVYASWKAQVMGALSAGILDPGGQYATSTGKCAGASAPPGPNDVALAAQAAGGSGAILGVLAATGVIPVFGPAIAGVAAVFLSLVSKLFGPPVSELETKTLCPAVAAANAVLNQITAELQAGLMSVSQANSAIAELRDAFQSHVASIEYVQTPNDTQLMVAELDALHTKNTNVIYPALGQNAASARAAAQASAAAAQQTQITAAANAAVAAAMARQAPPPAPVVAEPPMHAPQPPIRRIGPPTAAPPLFPVSTSSSAAPAQPTGPSPVVAAPSASGSWFSESTWGIPNWAFLLGGAFLLMET